jgi:hypothetical protein
MHDGRFKRLSEVLNHYTDEVVYTLALELIHPSYPVTREKADIISFFVDALRIEKFLLILIILFQEIFLLK